MRNTTRNARRLLLPAVLALVWFSGVRSSLAGWIEDADGKTVIHIKINSSSLPDPSNPDTKNRAEVAGVKAFKERFPAIFAKRYRDTYKADPKKYGRHNWDHVEVEPYRATGIRVEGVESDLLAIAGGLAPDVLYINFRKSDNYIRNGFLHPLDEYIATMTKEELAFRVNRKLWPVIERKGTDGKKHVWAFPYGGALGKVLLFRKDLFDQHDVPHPTVNWTWDKMLNAAKKMTNPKEGTFGLLLGRGKHESWYWCTFLWSAGGDVMAYDEEKDEWSCTFDSQEAAVALEFYTRMGAEKWIDKDGKIRRGYSSKDATENRNQLWDQGKIGMLMSYIDEKVFSTINPELTGMVPVPLGPTGKRGGELNSRMMGLYSEIEEPAVRDASWEFMRFYDSEEAVEIKTRIMVEGGLGRFVNPKHLHRFGYQELERLAPKGWSETFEIAIETGRPEP
jgi:ABC-type glycerol-3-phosphate transport system substrate-binding protein